MRVGCVQNCPFGGIYELCAVAIWSVRRRAPFTAHRNNVLINKCERKSNLSFRFSYVLFVFHVDRDLIHEFAPH